MNDREIKFRAWFNGHPFPIDPSCLEDYEKPQMIYGVEGLYDGMGVPKDKLGVLAGTASFGNLINNEDFILMQFTGLHDKNGVEIYEGDIVRYTFRDQQKIKEVVWLKTQATFTLEGEITDWQLAGIEGNKQYDCEYEVIGNIYQDSHLPKNKITNK